MLLSLVFRRHLQQRLQCRYRCVCACARPNVSLYAFNMSRMCPYMHLVCPKCVLMSTAVYVRARARLCLCVCTCTTCSLSRIPNTCSHKSLSLSQGFSHARERGCPPHHPTCTPTHMHTRTHAHTSSALANFLFIQRLCRLLHALRLGNDGLLIYSDM